MVASCCRLRPHVGLSEFLDFSENVVVMLREISHNSRVTKHFPEVPIRRNEIEVVGANNACAYPSG